MKVVRQAFFFALALGTSILQLQAASQTWQGDTSSTWGTTTNWSGNALPGNTDTATFNDTATTFTPDIASSTNVGTISIAGSNAFTFSQSNGVMYLRNATALTNTSSANQTFGGSNYRGGATGNATFTNNGTGLIDFNVPIYKEDAAVGSSSTNAGSLVFGGTGNFVVDKVGKRYGNLQSGLTKNGSGTLTIEGAMTTFDTSGTTGPHGLTNTITISDEGGTLKIMDPKALGIGDITIAKDGTSTGTLELALSGTNTITNTFTGFKSSTVSYVDGTANILNTSGTNTITSNLTVTSGGGNGMNFVSNGGLLELSGTLSTTVDSFRLVVLDGTGDGLVSGTIVDGSGGKAFTVRKSGSGTWTFSGNNTYSNSTQVLDGTLLVNGGNSGGGSYTVDTTGTLGGIGSIAASAVTVNGTLAPGASVGTLAVTGPVTFTNTGTLRIELDESQSGFVDLLDIDGNLSITSGADIDFSVAGALTQSEYIFGTYTGTLTGLFTSSTIPVGYLLEQGSGVLEGVSETLASACWTCRI